MRQERAGLRLIGVGVAGHPRIGADRLVADQPRHLDLDLGRHVGPLEDRVAGMAAVRLLVEQRLAGLPLGGIDRREDLRPDRRQQLGDLLFQLHEVLDVGAGAVAVDRRADRLELDVGEHADHLAHVAAERAEIEGRAERRARRDPVPLHLVLLMDVPQERIAHRRIGRVARLVARLGAQQHLVEDMAEGIEPGEAVAQRRLVRLLDRELPVDQLAERLLQERPVAGAVGAREHVRREPIPLVIVVARFDQSAVQRLHESLEIGQGRPAFDPHRLVLIGDLGGVTGRAGHARPRPRDWTGRSSSASG